MKKIISIILVLFTILGLIPTINSTAYAESVNYENKITRTSNLMVDLDSFSNFDINNYSGISEVYDVDLIFIAETNNNELIVYTHEPFKTTLNNQNHSAYNLTSINISKEIGNELEVLNYQLSPISGILYDSELNGCFRKYLVNNFTIESSNTRYYEIPSIFSDIAPSGLDASSLNTQTQTVNEQGYEVASKYHFETKNNGKISVYFEGTKVVTITSKFVGFVRYKDTATPSWIDNSSCDRHFVAFSTDMQMDKLKEADVYFVSQEIETYGAGYLYTRFGNRKDNYVNLNYTNKVLIENNDSLFWSGFNYSWNEIETISDFESEVNFTNVYKKGILNSTSESTLTTSEKNQLLSNDYVLSFYISDYSYTVDLIGEQSYANIDKEIVSEVSILRLRFETAGTEYNLGVVDNKQTGDTEPVNSFSVSSSFSSIDNLKTLLEKVKDFINKYWKLILIAIVVLLLFPLLAPLLPVIINFITLILKSLLQIILIPFRFILSLFNRKKK